MTVEGKNLINQNENLMAQAGADERGDAAGTLI
jgi:hypothetical protein